MTLCRPTLGAGTIALLILWSVSEIAYIVEAQTHVRRPVTATWSDQSYGPDGPWQAVQVSIGSSSQQIDLYPGGTWESIILLQDICTNTTLTSDCYASDAGVFSSAASTTWDNTSIDIAPDGSSYAAYSLGQTRAIPVNALARRAMDTIRFNGFTTPSVDIVGIDQGYQTYPGGQNYPLTVGILSLSAPDLNQSFSELSGPSINATFIPSYAYTSGMTSSFSYGMHIGSAALGISGSLYLGGYDQNRVLGNVSAQQYSTGSGNFPIQLQDIGLGVANGGSPWKFFNKEGLLSQGNTSLSSGVSIVASPADPYIYLPKSACDALATELPVTYQVEYGLYFWNTSDPRYVKIVTSPSYVGFTLNQNGVNNQEITINVPFALLNLTLEAPLVDKPTSYFPCMATNSSYALGRAFLQAAFVGFNWHQGIGNWFLAQAPGPGYSQTTISMIDPDATTITGSTSSWADSWSGHWTALPSESASSNNSSPSNGTSPQSSSQGSGSSGFSTGAKAGVGVGCAVAGLALIGVALWAVFLRRRRSELQQPGTLGGSDQKETTILEPVYPNNPNNPNYSTVPSQFQPSEIGSDPADPSIHGVIHELPGNHSGPFELPR